jgi:hypothetical protein
MSDTFIVADVDSPASAAMVSPSALAWRAVIGGALAAVAVTVILVTLGSGIGLSVASPYPNAGASAATLGTAAVIWLVVTQWIASAVGGYLTGRLRTTWTGVHSHEVFFRDTAHGFLAWALATVIGAFVLTTAVSGAIATGVHAGATATQGAGASVAGNGYYVDSLFRSDHPVPALAGTDYRAEAGRILATDLAGGEVSAPDRNYLAQLVAAGTGLSQADAQKRVDEVIDRVKAAANTARKTAASLSIVTALSMLIGAFIAAVAAVLGGRERDA